MAEPSDASAAEAEARGKHRVAVMRARRRQAAEGYDPERDFRGATDAGDHNVLRHWYSDEADGWRRRSLAAFLAAHDVHRLSAWAWSQEYQRRKAAQPNPQGTP
jgi:hypothetical protein